MASSTTKLKNSKFDSLTEEEIILLCEQAEDRLKENPLDSRANSDYNLYSELLKRFKNA